MADRHISDTRVVGDTERTYLSGFELVHLAQALVETRLDVAELLAAVLQLALRALCRLSRLINLSFALLTCARLALDFVLQVGERRLVRRDRLGELGHVALSLRPADLGLCQSVARVINLGAQVRDLGLLCAKLDATDLEDLLLQRTDLGVDLLCTALDLLQLALQTCDVFLELLNPSQRSCIRLHLRPVEEVSFGTVRWLATRLT